MGLFDIFHKKNEKNLKLNKYEFLKNTDIEMFHGINNEEIKTYAEDFFNTFGIEFPNDVKDFLNVTNGLYSGTGAHLYSIFNDEIKNKVNRSTKSTMDIIGFNVNYRMITDVEEFIFLGNDSLTFYAYEIESKKYCMLTNGTLDKLHEYDTLESMIKDIFINKV